MSEHFGSLGLVPRRSHRSAQCPLPDLPHGLLGRRHCRAFWTKVRTKVPKELIRQRVNIVLYRPGALIKDQSHEAETIPLQQIWRQSFILTHLYLPKVLQILVAKTVIKVLDNKFMTTDKDSISSSNDCQVPISSPNAMYVLVHPTIQPFISSISYQNRIERRTHSTNAIPPCIYYSTTLQLRKYQRLLRLFPESSKQHPPIVYISL